MRDRERGQDAGNPRTADGPWWAGLGLMGAGILGASGVGLLLWLILGGSGAADDWSSFYGAGKILAIGSVVAGTTVVARRRERDRN